MGELGTANKTIINSAVFLCLSDDCYLELEPRMDGDHAAEQILVPDALEAIGSDDLCEVILLHRGKSVASSCARVSRAVREEAG